MQFSDKALIISKQKFNENSAIISVLCENNGKYKGLVRGVNSAKNRTIYQIGNLVNITWQARLSQHLGYLNAELIEPLSMPCLNNMLKLFGLSSLCQMIDKTIAEREIQPDFFIKVIELIRKISLKSNWLVEYVLFEIELLKILGFALELNCCAATGTTTELIYVSPNSGRAVSKEAGKPYAQKLLALPYFLIEKNLDYSNKTINNIEIKNGLILSKYFLNKYIFKAHNINIPNIRIKLEEVI